jgi:hypothetical protein
MCRRGGDLSWDDVEVTFVVAYSACIIGSDIFLTVHRLVLYVCRQSDWAKSLDKGDSMPDALKRPTHWC